MNDAGRALARLLTAVLVTACTPSSAPPDELLPNTAAPTAAPDANAAIDPASLVQLSLLAARAPQGELEVAARFVIKDGWHIYWINPGENGLETKVHFRGPAEYMIGAPRFTAPTRFTSPGDISSFGYEREAMVFARVQQAGPAAATDAIEVDASWLACAHICVRGKGTARVAVSDLDDAAMEAADHAMAGQRARLPQPWSALGAPAVRWSVQDDGALLEVPLDAAAAAGRVDFFPGPQPSPDLTERRVAGHALQLRYRRPHQANAAVSGVLALGESFYELETPWPASSKELP